MRSKVIKIFIGFLIFFLTIYLAYANPGNDINDCSCSFISNPIRLENTGDSVDTFHISQQGTAAKWSNVFPKIIILLPSETLTIENLINAPCDTKGKFSLITRIESSEGTETIKQNVNIETCSNIELVFKEVSKSGCNCTPFEFEFWVKNTRDYTETYTMTLLDKGSIATANVFNPIILGPNEVKNVKLFLTPPCDTVGEVKTVFKISTEQSKYHADAPLTMDIQACPDVTIEEVEPTLLARLRPLLIVLLVLLLLLLLVLVAYYVLPGERLFYRRVKIKEPKIKKSKEVDITSNKDTLSRVLRIIFAIAILLIIALFIFKGIQVLVPSVETIAENETIEVTEELVEPTEVNETEVFDASPYLKNNLAYFYYVTLGLTILFLLLLFKLRAKPKKKAKKHRKKVVLLQDIKERWKLIVGAIVVLVIVGLTYFFRTKIPAFFATLKDFVVVYLVFIILGFVLLAILLFALAKLKKS